MHYLSYGNIHYTTSTPETQAERKVKPMFTAIPKLKDPVTGQPERYDPTTCAEMRELTRRFLINADEQEQQDYWHLITALRGPDVPSETMGMTREQQGIAYAARRKRKAQGVEVIRFHAFGGVMGGSARYRTDRSHIVLPPHEEQDHHDVHLLKAARVLGLVVKTAKETPKWKKLWSQIVQLSPPTGIVE
jgi:hypothetical protein